MYITELSTGDKILLKLNSTTPAYPVMIGKVFLYKTGKQYAKKQNIYFTGGTATIIRNSDDVLVLNFVSRSDPSFSGIAEIDYGAINLLYLYEGETNEATVAEGLRNKTTAPAMDIYRKKIILRWKE